MHRGLLSGALPPPSSLTQASKVLQLYQSVDCHFAGLQHLLAVGKSLQIHDSMSACLVCGSSRPAGCSNWTSRVGIFICLTLWWHRYHVHLVVVKLFLDVPDNCRPLDAWEACCCFQYVPIQPRYIHMLRRHLSITPKLTAQGIEPAVTTDGANAVVGWRQ